MLHSLSVTILCTGIRYEGHTIAEFQKKEVLEKGCVPVMHNSHGGVSVILREPFKGCGQVTAKQGFGKLLLPEHGVCASHHLQHSASSMQGVGHGPMTRNRSSVVSVWLRLKFLRVGCV